MTLEELLREVAQAAPREMGAEFSDETPLKFVEFSDPGCYLDFADPDPSNGTAIIAMLDAMDKAGWDTELKGWGVCKEADTGPEDALYAVEVQRWNDTLRAMDDLIYSAPTRAEAVAKAFVSVFRAEVVE